MAKAAQKKRVRRQRDTRSGTAPVITAAPAGSGEQERRAEKETVPESETTEMALQPTPPGNPGEVVGAVTAEAGGEETVPQPIRPSGGTLPQQDVWIVRSFPVTTDAPASSGEQDGRAEKEPKPENDTTEAPLQPTPPGDSGEVVGVVTAETGGEETVPQPIRPSGRTLLQQCMDNPAFRARVISRVVKEMR